MASNTPTYYDSDISRTPLVTEFRNLWNYRGLIWLLTRRDLTVRYKRSTLGLWWTLLNPLLTTFILWMVFGQFFRFEIPGTPYVVYLLSGILLITYFAQAVQASGAAIVNNAGILTKVFVPAEVFSFSTVASATVNFLISLLPMAIIQLITGVGIPWTVILVPIPILAMFALTAGIGLLVAAAAVFFYDVLDLTAVLIQLISYLTPTFYPIAIVPEWALPILYANPLFSYLEVFRGFMYQGTFAPAWNFAYMIISAIVSLLFGVYVFSRSWRNLIAVL
jgi:ABC-type polysaccharide/polyol phosphate export permease